MSPRRYDRGGVSVSSPTRRSSASVPPSESVVSATEFGGEASRGVMVNKTTQHRLSLIREFTAKYRARIVHGLAIYGEFDPATDNRILAYEALEECLDIGAYLEMLEEKHEVMGPKIRPIMSKTILLYGDLKALVQEESSRTRERGSAA